MELLNQRIADGRVLSLLESMMKAGYSEGKQIQPNNRGVPRLILRNILM
jgi:hypothetical protein